MIGNFTAAMFLIASIAYFAYVVHLSFFRDGSDRNGDGGSDADRDE